MYLRSLELKDAPLMYEWMRDVDIVENMKADFGSKRIEDCFNFINAANCDKYNMHFALADDDDEYLGTVSLKHIKKNTAELGIVVRRKAIGKGYATKAMRKVIAYGYEHGINLIYWCVDPANKRAIRFYDKNGYTRATLDKILSLEAPQDNYSSKELSSYVWYLITKDE